MLSLSRLWLSQPNSGEEPPLWGVALSDLQFFELIFTTFGQRNVGRLSRHENGYIGFLVD